MAKRKVQLKKTPSVKKAKQSSARKAEPKKKAKAAPKGKAKATPKKKAQVVPAKKVKGVPKTQPRQKATANKASKKAVSTKKKATPTKAPQNAKVAAKRKADLSAASAGRLRKELRALPHSQLCTYWQQIYGVQLGAMGEETIHLAIDGHIQHLQEAGRDEDIEEAVNRVERIKHEASKPATKPDAETPSSHPDLRQRVAALLNKLNDDSLQWLHFEMTDPDAEGEIETDEEADEARANFPPLNRPALVQELTTIAVDDFRLADDSDLAETLRDESSIRLFLISNKD